MNIIILGQQGCGKGTQAEKLASKYGLIHVDMGSALREVAKMDNELGREVYKIQNITKTLVSSKILREVLHLKLSSIPSKQGVVFDGVPRTLDQTEYIEEALKDFGRELEKVFFINISPEESLKRISRRWFCSKCRTSLIWGKDFDDNSKKCPQCSSEEIVQREDDTPEGIQKRLLVFDRETRPVIDFYQKKGLVAKIDGEQDVEDVFQDMLAAIGSGNN